MRISGLHPGSRRALLSCDRRFAFELSTGLAPALLEGNLARCSAIAGGDPAVTGTCDSPLEQ